MCVRWGFSVEEESKARGCTHVTDAAQGRRWRGYDGRSTLECVGVEKKLGHERVYVVKRARLRYGSEGE